ncbi:MAG TPA: RecQ family ATP-dependent DNA helicase [Pirellulaceae bacterium]|nr:RecQ family ATP-dependent DNA helicase [Pirellulaceae bacterium]
MPPILDDPLTDPLARFGLSSFRPGQREVIQAVLDRKDALCIMPTGGGKSLCYQLPAVVRDGLTLVVSPLIALMKDQVDALSARGIAATFVNSSLTQPEQLQRIERMAAGEYDLVYIAPERLRSTVFLEMVRESKVQLLAVDEAHCISEWGHDFRPDYARLGRFRERLGFPQTIGLTATATPKVRADILQQLRLREPAVFITGFARENLRFEVEQPVGGRDKFDDLLTLVKETPGAGIVYCSTRKRCAEVVELLREEVRVTGRKVGLYHAGLEPDARRRVQEDFMAGRVPIIVATNAFGMGIDKADLRFVVHYNMPGSLEAYYQEAGRAGRDGLPSRCVLLFSGDDRYIQEFFIDNKFPPREAVQKVYDLLRRLDADPIELTLDEIKDKLGLKITSEGIGACEKLLERAGVLERLDTRENRAAVRIDSDLPTLVDFLSPEAKVQRKVLQAIEKLVGAMRHERVYIQPSAVARLTELDQPAINRAIKELSKLRDFDYVPPFRGRAVHMLNRDTPFAQLDIDWKALADRKAAEYEKLDRVVRYAFVARCRQAAILDYFGDKSAHQCGVCDNCTQSRKPAGASQAAARAAVADEPALVEGVRMVLSGIARAQGRFGKNLVAEMLVGGTTKKISRTSLTGVSTYGLLKGLSARSVAELIDALTMHRLVSSTSTGDVRRPLVNLTELGGSVMRGKLPVPAAVTIDSHLATQLKAAVARRSGNAAPEPHQPPRPVPAPTAMMPVKAVSPHATEKGVAPPPSDVPVNKLPHHWTWHLLARGFSVDDCIAIRQIDSETFYDHLLRSAKEGLPVNPHWLVTADTWQRLVQFLGDTPPEQVKDRLGELPAGITYRDVQWYVVARKQHTNDEGHSAVTHR